MAISVTRDDIKRRCMLSTSEYDTKIDDLRDEMVNALNYALLPEHRDTGDTALQDLLNLAALEIICGMFMDQLALQPGWSESFSMAGLDIHAFEAAGGNLIAQGYQRLAPYLRDERPVAFRNAVDAGDDA